MVYEIIGFVGMTFVLLSFMMTSETSIRQVNLMGALISFVYGLLIGAMSVYVLNGLLVMINLVKLTQNGKVTSRARE